jgi:probable HAF family extracellular repeat protein
MPAAAARWLAIFVGGASLHAQSITAIGNFTAAGLSADGMAAAGTNGTPQAVRWSSAGGITPLATVGDPAISRGLAISADGTTVVGNSGSTGGPSPNYQAFRWTQSGGTMALGVPTGWTNSDAAGVSSNGTVVAGTVFRSWDFVSQAYVWTGGVFTVLPTTGGSYGYGYGLSADGTTVVGISTGPADETSYAAMWRNGVATSLGPTIGTFSNAALGVSADGTVIAGYSNYIGTDKLAFRWSNPGGMQALSPLLGGTTSVANAVSTDGVLVAGYSNGIAGQNATIWEPDGTAHSLYDLVSAQSSPPGGWTFQSINAIMGSNGNFDVLGYGTYLGNGQDFVITGLNFTAIPEPSVYGALIGLIAIGRAIGCRRRRTPATARSVRA